MITIKQFAMLCGCNTQTLRYYDRVGLLCPARVDDWTGYRYYEERQAVDFIKIKNLQRADFTLEEIKRLLDESDEVVYAAFEQKIAAAREKLAEIEEIQQSYLKEKTMMEQLIDSLAGLVMGQIGDYEDLWEFGIDPQEGDAVAAQVREYLTAWLGKDLNQEDLVLRVDGEDVQGPEEVLKKLHTLEQEPLEATQTILLGKIDPGIETFDPDNYDTLWTRDGWQHVYEFIDDLPALEKGREYCLFFHLAESAKCRGTSFALFMLGALLIKRGCTEANLGCYVDTSPDGRNTFSLLRRK